MKTKDLIVKTLNEQPNFRERSRKDRGIVALLRRRFGNIGELVTEGRLSNEDLIAFVQDYASMDRAWRQALEQNPELRGSDYEEKKRLEQEKQIELGYGQGPKD